MKKLSYMLIGVLMGVGLTISVSAAAEEIQSLIGKQVQGQVAVVVDGKEISVPAAIIDGTSYAPVRAVGEAVGRDVDWEEGKVILDIKQESATPEVTPSSPIPTPTSSPVVYSKDRIDAEIQRLELELYVQKTTLDDQPNWKDKDGLQKKISDNEAELAVWKQRLAELEKQ